MKIAQAVSLALVVSSVAARAATLEVDPAYATAQFAVKRMMVGTVRGGFGKVTGRVELNREDPGRSTVEASIDAATIDTRNTTRDNHLRSADFFDVQRCPTIHFKSNKVEKIAKDRWKMSGDLTMRCVTKPVTFDVEGLADGVKDPKGVLRYGATAVATVDRREFGLTWNKTLDSGGLILGNQVTLTVDAELTETGAGAKSSDTSGAAAAKK